MSNFAQLYYHEAPFKHRLPLTSTFSRAPSVYRPKFTSGSNYLLPL